ncbi:unnamed protein product [Enterobius vermicularis]|uniref:CDK5 regulatory subunit-associated protein 3 n=1 Tax=Enterobius vermicularis TaxID=51028 RepID=A0A0N4VK01_ENTVE|nr:unnamed protein product [Enterobius vermicularis]
MAAVQQLPIDLHSSKLLDWLISRRHCKKDWQSKAMVIREKIKNAILDMPENQRIVELLQGTYINYFHCLEIVTILRETEKETKNFFGFYSSQRMNDWLEIKSLYEKDSVYLAEAAQILQRLVQYDIPALKKQITKNDSTVVDCERKEEDYFKQANNSKKQYEKRLEELGVEGKRLRLEIQMLAADLPTFFAASSKRISHLAEPVEYYKNFSKYVTQNSSKKITLLPICSMLISQGSDITVYEWRHGRKPNSVERPTDLADALSAEMADEGCSKKEDEIDFGDDDEIDFGEEDVTSCPDGFIVCTSEGDSVSGVKVVESPQNKLDDGVARGVEGLSLLECEETRNQIVNELDELHTFLLSRLDDETTENSANIYISGFESRPANIASATVEKISSWKSEVDVIYSELTDKNRCHLFKIYNSPEYVTTVLESLEHSRSLEGRYLQMRNLMVEKRTEAVAAANKARDELSQIVKATKILQHQIEEDISKRYKGTPVNIMGGIVAALKAV